MARVCVTEIARHDLRRIISDLSERAGDRVAARYVVEFKAAYRRLAELPEIGPPRPALGTKVRISIVRPYIVFYEYADDTVTVLRVLHGKRSITRELVRR